MTPVLYRFKSFQGPRRYKFKDPDTGHLFEADKKPDLLAQIVSYREQNKLPPIELLSLVLENYLCTLEENRYNCEPYRARRGMMATLKGGVALLKNMAFRVFAPQPLAEKRAAQCSTCPYNKQHRGDAGFQAWSNEVAEASVGDRATSNNHNLGECAACGCPLKAKVFYAGPVSLSVTERTLMQGVGCWQLELEQKK